MRVEHFEVVVGGGVLVKTIVEGYFKTLNAPGLLLYEEFLVANAGAGRDRREIEHELQRALEVLKYLGTTAQEAKAQ